MVKCKVCDMTEATEHYCPDCDNLNYTPADFEIFAKKNSETVEGRKEVLRIANAMKNIAFQKARGS